MSKDFIRLYLAIDKMLSISEYDLENHHIISPWENGRLQKY